MPKLDFAVLGAGAMGSILGAHLARAGHSVSLQIGALPRGIPEGVRTLADRALDG